ncbi:MAG: DoxX family protein [Sphingobium sp.]|nr:DoxX family protein [Sphingobium sp.]MCP5400127.1 DoxX family protein [Sphingomonas sp.]
MDKLVVFGPGLARIVMGLFYWVMAAGLAKDFRMVTGLMATKGVPAQAPLLAITILVWIVGGAMLVLGRGVVPAALILFVLTALVTPVIHNFWAAPPELAANEIQHFFKNVAILAGLVCIAATAAGASPAS